MREERLLISEVRAWARSHLSKGRLRHVEGTVRAITRLAARFGIPASKARLTAWLHDATKEMTKSQMRVFMRGTPFRWDRHEMRIPALRHSKASAALAWKKWGVRDRRILLAIAHHPLGIPGMGKLEAALFVADLIEPSRRFRGLADVRKACRLGLWRGAEAKAERTLAHLKERGGIIHPRLAKTHEWLKGRKGRK